MSLMKNRPSGLLVSAALTAILLLSSCLNINAEIDISGNGSIKTTIIYTLDESINDFGRGFGTDDPWPFPLSEADFNQRVLLVEGTRLVRYRMKDNGTDGDEITAVVRAESLEAMASFLDMPMDMNSGDEGGSLVMELPSGSSYMDSTEASRQVIDALIGQSTIRFSVRPPSKPTGSEGGVIDGRSVSLELNLLDVLYGRAPESWSVSW